MKPAKLRGQLSGRLHAPPIEKTVRRLSRLCLLWFMPCAACCVAQTDGTEAADAQASLEDVVAEGIETIENSVKTQAEINQLHDEVQLLRNDYRLKLQALERATRYQENLIRTLQDQEREKRSLAGQIDNFGEFEQGIVPLLMDMVDQLDEFIRLDAPLLSDMRNERVSRLREIMGRADVSISEKYRHVMQAYLEEARLGRTIEAYAGQLDVGDDTSRQVEFFRLGRVALIYRTSDREIAGYYDMDAKAWRNLPRSYDQSVNLAMRIAKKQAAPELLTLPVPAASNTEQLEVN